MATTTPNFGWSVPTSTDLVKDGATAIETLGDAIDASMVDLKGGTTGQVLAKASNTDLDFVWSADAAGMTNPMTTTGDTIYSSSGSTPARLGIGSSGQVLTVSGGVPTWATASAGATTWTLINTGGTALTGAATITVSSLSGYNRLYIMLIGASSASAGSEFNMRFNTDTTSKYNNVGPYYIFTPSFGNENQALDGDTSLRMGQMGTDTAANRVAGFFMVEGANSTGRKLIYSMSSGEGTGAKARFLGGSYSGTSVISSVSIISGTGNFDNGTIYIYGAN